MPKAAKSSKATPASTPAPRRTTRSQSQVPGAAPLAGKLPTPRRRPVKKTSKNSAEVPVEPAAAVSAVSAPPAQTAATTITAGASHDSGIVVTDSQEITDAERTDVESTDAEQTGAEATGAEPSEAELSKNQFLSPTRDASTQTALGVPAALAAVVETRAVSSATQTGGSTLRNYTSADIGVQVDLPRVGASRGKSRSSIDKLLDELDLPPVHECTREELEAMYVKQRVANDSLSARISELRRIARRQRKALEAASLLGKRAAEEDGGSGPSKRLKPAPEPASRAATRPQLDPRARNLIKHFVPTYGFGARFPMSPSPPPGLASRRSHSPPHRSRQAYSTPVGGNAPDSREQAGSDAQDDERSKEKSAGTGLTEQHVQNAPSTPPAQIKTAVRPQTVGPSAPTSSSWGIRSLWGSVSKFIPGRTGGTSASAVMTESAAAPTTSVNSESDLRSQQQNNTSSPTSSGRTEMPPPIQPSKAQSSTQSRSTAKSAESRKTEPPTNSIVVAPFRREAWPMTARLSERPLTLKRRRTGVQTPSNPEISKRDALRERFKKMRREVDPANPKRVKIPVDSLPNIPTRGPGEKGGTYGLIDDYFTYGRDMDTDDEVEMWDTEVPWSQLKLNPKNKRQRMSSPRIPGAFDVPKFADMPESISNAASSSQVMTDPTRARPYIGRTFADANDATTYKGGNVFDQSQSFSSEGSSKKPVRAADPLRNTGAVTKGQPNPEIAEQVRKYGHSDRYDPNFNWAGHFCVPEGSDSEDDESMDNGEDGSPGAQKDGASIKSSVSNTPGSNQNTQKSHSLSSSQRDMQPPPRPTLAHASLPGPNPASNVPAANPAALARARSQAEKYKPKQPSGLRASSRLSTPTIGSDAGDDEVTPTIIAGATPDLRGGMLNQSVGPFIQGVSTTGNVFSRARGAGASDSALSAATEADFDHMMSPFMFPSGFSVSADLMVDDVVKEETVTHYEVADSALDGFQTGLETWTAEP